MAMPRYRYAIGQAPVRFPSLNPNKDLSKQDKPISSILQCAVIKKQRSSNELRKDQKRSIEEADKLQTSRNKAKSMYEGEGGVRSTLKVEATPRVPQNTPRTSMAGHGASRSRDLSASPSLERISDERTHLLIGSEAMTQRSARPASTSISRSSRPSSLFWTEEEEAIQTPQLATAATHKVAYGSINDAKMGNSDPYGYRALAGPSLLPSFHEQQVQQQKRSESKSRYCGSTFIHFSGQKWLMFTISASLIIIIGLYYSLF